MGDYGYTKDDRIRGAIYEQLGLKFLIAKTNEQYFRNKKNI